MHIFRVLLSGFELKTASVAGQQASQSDEHFSKRRVHIEVEVTLQVMRGELDFRRRSGLIYVVSRTKGVWVNMLKQASRDNVITVMKYFYMTDAALFPQIYHSNLFMHVHNNRETPPSFFSPLVRLSMQSRCIKGTRRQHVLRFDICPSSISWEASARKTLVYSGFWQRLPFQNAP